MSPDRSLHLAYASVTASARPRTRRFWTNLAEHAIGIESCLTSNIQTSTAVSLESHPLNDFLDRGILATINTDDPTVSGLDLAQQLTSAAGLTPDHVRKAQENALGIAFLEPDERKALLEAGR